MGPRGLEAHVYDSDGYVTSDYESLTGWISANLTLTAPTKGSCVGGSAECEEAFRTSVREYGYVGDGWRSWAEQRVDYDLERTSFANAQRIKRARRGCWGTSCSRVQEYVWGTLSDGTAVQLARSEWGGGWTTWDWAVPAGGTAAVLPELRGVTRGAVSAGGDGALETVRYAYATNSAGTGGILAERLRTEERRVSVLQPGADTVARTVYDSSTNRIKAVIRSGYTQGLSQVWDASPVLKHQGTFYFTRHACLGSTAEDPLGRVLEVHGPCWVDGPEATDCSASLNARVPVTQYHYWPAGTGTPNANRLQKEVRYTGMAGGLSCAGQPTLETLYADYDAWGNPQSVTDPNGIETRYTYQEDRVTSLTTQGATWSYQYEYGKLSAVRFPRGDYESFCFYDDGGYGSCSPLGGPWLGVLAKRTKQALLNSNTWSESIRYTYGADKRLHREMRNYGDGWNVGERQARFFEADPNGNPTYEFAGGRYGNPNGYSRSRLFDGANRMVGTGLAYNSPPGLCGGLGADGRPVSPLCSALSYDRADRLTGIDEYPEAGTRANGTRTCMSYDAHGNVTGVRTGCPASGAGGDCSACAQPESVYRYDDFGNLISVDLPWLGGTGRTRYSHDARGNLLAKQTPRMALDGEHLAFTYDALGRPLAATRVVGGTAPQAESLYTFSYDASATPDTGCPQPANTRGRLQVRNDSFGQTWFSYDAWGRVTKEIRVRRSAAGTFTCPSDTPASTLHTTYGYSTSGDLLSVEYPYGHRVTYTYANHPNSSVPSDRVSGLTLARWDGSGWAALASISNVYWEPYGDVWGYQINAPGAGRSLHVEYLLGHDSGSVPASACTDPAPPHSDFTGRLRSLWVSGGAFSWAGGNADIFRRTYTWRGDQIAQVDTCLLGATTPLTEKYVYDGMGRLSTASRPAGNFAATGGAFESRGYGYDGRGNRLTQVEDGTALTLTHGAGEFVDRLERRRGSATGSLLDYSYLHDEDGRVTEKRWVEVGGAPVNKMRFNLGPSVGGASETVFRSVDVNGTTYEYFYDALGRRRLKRYPSTAEDEFFHGLDNQLLVDRGNPNVVPPPGGFTHHVDDTYVWLGGRPVMVVRGRLTAQMAREPNPSGDCGRNGEAAACGVYFPVTDTIGKVVLMLDGTGRVAGAADHEPFGHVNRVAMQRESAHPLPMVSADGGTPDESILAELVQPVPSDGGSVVRQRALFHLLDTGDVGSVELRNATDGTVLAGGLTDSQAGGVWSPWVTSAEGRASVVLAYNAGAQGAAQGVVVEGFEYQRYQAGAQPFWVPLRFPGQYHDTETDLFENWNRYYDPSIGRYLQPEPLAHDARYLKQMALAGWLVPVYTYALGNPVKVIDPDGNSGFVPLPPVFPYPEYDGDIWESLVDAFKCHFGSMECPTAPNQCRMGPPKDSPEDETCELLFNLCYTKWGIPMNTCNDCRSICKRSHRKGQWPFEERKCKPRW